MRKRKKTTWQRDRLGVLAKEEYIRQLPEADGFKGSGIYFLWNRNVLQYIGSSRDVPNRLYMHHAATRAPDYAMYPMRHEHDRVTVYACPADELEYMESLFIYHYEPPGNS